MTLVSNAGRLLDAQRPATERVCPRCAMPFVGRGRARYCSVRCRNRASDTARRARGGLSRRELARAREGARRWSQFGGRTMRWMDVSKQLFFTRENLAWAGAWDTEMEAIEIELGLASVPGSYGTAAGILPVPPGAPDAVEAINRVGESRP